MQVKTLLRLMSNGVRQHAVTWQKITFAEDHAPYSTSKRALKSPDIKLPDSLLITYIAEPRGRQQKNEPANVAFLSILCIAVAG